MYASSHAAVSCASPFGMHAARRRVRDIQGLEFRHNDSQTPTVIQL
jgi:hypothetical protein